MSKATTNKAKKTVATATTVETANNNTAEQQSTIDTANAETVENIVDTNNVETEKTVENIVDTNNVETIVVVNNIDTTNNVETIVETIVDTNNVETIVDTNNVETIVETIVDVNNIDTTNNVEKTDETIVDDVTENSNKDAATETKEKIYDFSRYTDVSATTETKETKAKKSRKKDNVVGIAHTKYQHFRPKQAKDSNVIVAANRNLAHIASGNFDVFEIGQKVKTTSGEVTIDKNTAVKINYNADTIVKIHGIGKKYPVSLKDVNHQDVYDGVLFCDAKDVEFVKANIQRYLNNSVVKADKKLQFECEFFETSRELVQIPENYTLQLIDIQAGIKNENCIIPEFVVKTDAIVKTDAATDTTVNTDANVIENADTAKAEIVNAEQTANTVVTENTVNAENTVLDESIA